MAKRIATVDQRICVACGACTKECPRDAIHVFAGCYAKVDAVLCIGCGRCAKICPAGVIEVVERGSAE